MPEAVEHGLLGGRVRLLQPAGGGYRAAIDPVLLAAAVPAERAGMRVLDVGVGTGAALLCLLARCPEVEATGLEVLPEHADLAVRSLALNGWSARIVVGDVRDRPAPVEGNAFDLVMTNPPFHGPGTRPPHAGRAGAHMEDVPLAEWLDFCLRRLRPRGVLCAIHRADRLDDILAALAGKAGAVEVIPLWPKAGQAAKRVIVRARKGARSPAVLHPGLVLHGPDGAYTAQAQAVLRDGAALDLAHGGG